MQLDKCTSKEDLLRLAAKISVLPAAAEPPAPATVTAPARTPTSAPVPEASPAPEAAPVPARAKSTTSSSGHVASGALLKQALEDSLERSAAAQAVKRQQTPGAAGIANNSLGAADIEWAHCLGTEVQVSRDNLAALQHRVGTAEPESPELLGLITERDVLRYSHVNLLARAVRENQGRGIMTRVAACEEQAEALEEELSHEHDQGVHLGEALSRQLHLSRLRATLKAMQKWEQDLAQMQAELEDMRPHAAGNPPSVEQLHQLYEAWDGAVDAFLLAEVKVKRGKPGAEAAMAKARKSVQQTERKLRVERSRLAITATAHWPELMKRESMLNVGGADADCTELQGLLVERNLGHYSGQDGEAAPVRVTAHSRHRLYR